MGKKKNWCKKYFFFTGRSTSVVNESNMNEEYFDTKDDELTPTYDDKNYTEDVDTSPIEPR